MKVWIDKTGGYHYHKEGCRIMDVKHPHSDYEEIEHKVRRLGMPYHKEYVTITIEGRRYIPCPFCFGYGWRK